MNSKRIIRVLKTARAHCSELIIISKQRGYQTSDIRETVDEIDSALKELKEESKAGEIPPCARY